MDKAKYTIYIEKQTKGYRKNEDTNKCCASYQVSDLGEQLWFQILCFIVSIWVKLDCHNIYPSFKFRQYRRQKEVKRDLYPRTIRQILIYALLLISAWPWKGDLMLLSLIFPYPLKWYNWSRWPPKISSHFKILSIDNTRKNNN